MRQLIGVFAALLLACEPALAQHGEFKRLQLPRGISIEVPSHWMILDQATRSNLRASRKAITDNAGIDGPSSRKESLLAVNATPDPPGATIRVSVSPAEYSQADLAAITKADLMDIGVELQATLKKTESSGGPKLIQMHPVRVDTVNGYRALVFSYTRQGVIGPSPWQVNQYKIPLPDRLLEITLSYRESDAIVWRPIIEKVSRSVTF